MPISLCANVARNPDSVPGDSLRKPSPSRLENQPIGVSNFLTPLSHPVNWVEMPCRLPAKDGCPEKAVPCVGEEESVDADLLRGWREAGPHDALAT